MPFEHAVGAIADLLRVQISEPTGRRQTEKWGAAYACVLEEEVERIEKDLPPPPVGPEKMLLSVDGAMVPLVKGEWTEAKTLVLGVINEPVLEGDEWKVHATELSYFSRVMEAETFGHAALSETHRRGVETACQVVAVTDGALWEQGFIDYHREDAVRILDFPHAAEYVAQIGSGLWGEGTERTKEWLQTRLHMLKHEGPTELLRELRSLVQEHADLTELGESLSYLEKREPLMHYPLYMRQGWPIGSGAVESGNKVVVEARLKGAGMHWARGSVNPMLALRNAVCNGRWTEARSQILAHQHLHTLRMRQSHRERRLADQAAASVSTERESRAQHAPPTAELTPEPHSKPHVPDAPASAAPSKPWRPAPDHPWRHSPIGKARYRKPSQAPPARK